MRYFRGQKRVLVRDKVFEFICNFKKEHDGISPNYREICANFGWSSQHNAVQHVSGLIRDGVVRFDECGRIMVIDGEYIPPDQP